MPILKHLNTAQISTRDILSEMVEILQFHIQGKDITALQIGHWFKEYLFQRISCLAEHMVKNSQCRLEEFNKSHIQKPILTVNQMYHLLWLKLKRETILQIFNGAQMRVIEKFFLMVKLQLLSIHSQDSTAKIPAMLMFISQLQSITKLHLHTSKILKQLQHSLKKTLQNQNSAEPTVKKSLQRLVKLCKSHIGKIVSTADQMHHLLWLKLQATLQISNGAQMRVTEKFF
jgi:hypothetical protein